MTVTTTRYVRKTFYIEAIQVTADNISEVAEWCRGAVKLTDDDKWHIKLHVYRPLTLRQTMAFVGDWVLLAGSNFKIYTDKAFTKSFEKVSIVEPLFIDGLVNDKAVQAEKLS